MSSCFEKAPLAALAAQYGTPTYLFDLDALRRRIAAVGALFGEDVTLCYSIKANPFLLAGLDDDAAAELRLEVCSPGELAICEAVGVDAGRIVYSGVNKQPADTERAVAYGVGTYTAESLRQVATLQAAAAAAGKTCPVLLRLAAGSQFGMSAEDLRTALAERAKTPNLDFVGLHYFVGTQRRKMADRVDELAMLKELFAALRAETGLALPRLEYGPGLPVPYFTTDDFTDDLAPARALAPLLREVCGWAELTVEMGRFFAAPCGAYLTRVEDCKQHDTLNYAILDGGIHQLNYLGQMMGMKQPVVRHLPTTPPAPQAARQDWVLCGSLCTTGDILVRRMPLTGLACGDILCFENTGAYSVTEGISLFLSRALPAVVLLENGTPRLARPLTESAPLNTPNIGL